MRWLDSITDSMDMNLSKFQEIVKDRGVWHAAVHGIAKSCTRLSDWTVTTNQGFPTAPKILLSLVLSTCLWSHSLPNLLSLPHPTSIEAADIKSVEFVNPEWQRSVSVLSFAHCLAQSLKHAKVKSESVSHSVMSNFLWPPWTVAHQAPLSMVFSRQGCWSGLPFPSLLWLIFHCIKVPSLLYSSIFVWIFRMFPCPGYCKCCCNEQWDAYIFSFQLW